MPRAKKIFKSPIFWISLTVTFFTLWLWIKSRGGFGEPFRRARKFHLRNRGKTESDNLNAFNKAIELYQEQMHKDLDENKFKLATRRMIDIGNVYREGMPDRYGPRGRKIKGVPRDLQKALYWYNQAYRYGNLEGLLLTADVHHYDFIEDNFVEGARENARKLYLYLSTKNNRYLEAVANDRLLQMTEDEGTTFTPIDPYFYQPINHAINTRRPRQEQRAIQPLRRATQFELDQIEQLNAFPQYPAQRPQRNHGRPQRDITNIRNDPQNTHDHVVVNTVRESVRKLKAQTDQSIPLPMALSQVRNYINTSDMSEAKRSDAIATLDKIESSQGLLSGTSESESDVLGLVWNRIHSDINRDNLDSLKRNLVNELAEGVEHGRVVCSRGRFNRIVDSLNKVDPAVEIKPMWVLQQEMLGKAAAVRNEMENGLSKQEKDALETLEPTPEQEQIVDSFKQNFVGKLKQNFQQEYVASGLMSQEIMDAELNKWVEHAI